MLRILYGCKAKRVEMSSETRNINVRLPKDLEERLSGFEKEHGYTSKSEVVRDALRRLLEPELSTQALKDVILSREQVKAGKTVPQEELKKRLDLEKE